MSIAMAYPRTSAPQDALCAIATRASRELEGREAAVKRLYEGTMVARRGVCVLGEGQGAKFFPPAGDDAPSTRERVAAWLEHACEMGVRAASDALQRSGIAPGGVTHLITASCTGLASPGVDQALIVRVGMGPGVQRTNIGFMGCHAMINALRVARAIGVSEPASVTLAVASEVCSVHFQHEHLSTDRIIANALFADGAGACVVAGEHAAVSASAHSLAPLAPLARIASTASTLVPNTRDAMTWTMGEHGFVMTLSKEVPALIERALRPWLEAWLGSHALALEDVRSWCVHPGGPRVLESVERSLALPPDALRSSRDVLREHGNMSSPTVLAILERELAREPVPWPCVVLAFGPGLTAEAALIGRA
jgi:predicted naringenin-chalcone synthase